MEEHGLTLQGRQRLTVTGITEVLRFDDTAGVLETELGQLTVQGSQLQMKTLSVEGGRVEVTGEVDGLGYQTPGVPWLRRLLG